MASTTYSLGPTFIPVNLNLQPAARRYWKAANGGRPRSCLPDSLSECILVCLSGGHDPRVVRLFFLNRVSGRLSALASKGRPYDSHTDFLPKQAGRSCAEEIYVVTTDGKRRLVI